MEEKGESPTFPVGRDVSQMLWTRVVVMRGRTGLHSHPAYSRLVQLQLGPKEFFSDQEGAEERL
jgi:hypothetical protein